MAQTEIKSLLNKQLDDPKKENGVKSSKEGKNDKKVQKQSIDIAFILDCTGSMGSYIQSCKDNINTISSQINKDTNNEYDVQFGLVLYRDLKDSFITKIIHFTPIPFKIELALNKISATGGDDQPEAMASGLYDCYKNLKWRNDSIKVIVVITDAPPHGLEKVIHDNYPNGDIDTFNAHKSLQKEGNNPSNNNDKYLNIIDIIQSIRNNLNASIYTVACEPSLSCDNDYSNDFMQYMAEYTNGKFLPLNNAKLLPKVIIGSIKQQINMDDLSNKLEIEIINIKKEYGDDISNDKLNELIMKKWKNEGVKKKEISVGDVYKNKRSRINIDLLLNEQKIKSLNDFKKKCKLLPRMERNNFVETYDKSYKTPKTFDTVSGHVKTEHKLLMKAEKRQNNSGRCCCIALCFIVISLLVIFIYGCLVYQTENEWIYSVIIIPILFCLGLSWLVYRFWWEQKKSAAELGDAEDELDDAIAENCAGFGADLDAGDVKFNPMATGVPGMNRPVDAFGNEMVDTQAEVFQVRQDYGQVAPRMIEKNIGHDDINNILAYSSRKY